MTGAEMIAAERGRQHSEEGYSAEHDREHSQGELAGAAACYAVAAIDGSNLAMVFAELWPRNWRYRRASRMRMLVKAGALIAAEIDRLAALAGEGKSDA